jgi:23S rRNA (adenine2503-C2)-methyltransferase
MQNIFNYKYDELEEFLVSIGEKKYRTKQLYEWLYRHKIYSYNEMSNLGKGLTEKLGAKLDNKFIKIVEVQKTNEVNKYLFQLLDDNYIEAVLMKHDYGNSLCVSSQVGCNISCAFCEAGRQKKVKDLEAHEMVQQILLVEEDLGERIDSVVIMGIGEPFDNYDNLMKFIRIINSPHGLAIGARHITISTCGIIPGIKRFSEEEIQVNLAVSLHAPNDEIRNQIMPISKVYKIEDLINTLKEYTKRTNRRIAIEYVILNSINDSEELAKELANLVKGMNVYVNLIPYNETSHSNFKKASKDKQDKFFEVLHKEGIDVTVRKEFGSKISAACGQLRSERS